MKSHAGKSSGAGTTARGRLPLYCDYHCPHASFPPVDATGACRREQGVYCRLLRSFNTKNSPCKARPKSPR
jgi:hypothetical protein